MTKNESVSVRARQLVDALFEGYGENSGEYSQTAQVGKHGGYYWCRLVRNHKVVRPWERLATNKDTARAVADAVRQKYGWCEVEEVGDTQFAECRACGCGYKGSPMHGMWPRMKRKGLRMPTVRQLNKLDQSQP